jgi:acetyl esterase/lipase
MRFLFFWLFASVVLISCKKKDVTADVSAVTINNVAYGNDPKQAMDIFLPANRSLETTPFIILIHGGGWTSGDRVDFRPLVDTIKKRLPGYAIFNISYRLASGDQNLFPTQENDVKAALGSILSKLTEYRISDRYALIGASAGGHLALLNAYKVENGTQAKAVVSFFGPTELKEFYNAPPNIYVQPLLQEVTGGTPLTKPSIYASSSPLQFVKSGSCPTLILHGGADIVVPPSQSDLLRDRLSLLNVPHQYVFYPGKGHGDWDPATYQDAFQQLQLFLKLHLP